MRSVAIKKGQTRERAPGFAERALFAVTIAARSLSSLTIPHFWMGQSLSVKPIGS